MRRLLAYWPVAALAVAATMLALRPLLMRNAVRRMPQARVLSAPRPTAAEVRAAPGLDSVFAGAPPPRFRVLEYDEVSPGPPSSLTETVASADGWRTLRQERRETSFDGRVVRTSDAWVAGAAGLMDDYSRDAEFWGTETTWATGIRGIRGRLFPLAVGNRLQFTCDVHTLSRRERSRPQAVTFVFTVTGTTDEYAHATPAIPGPVYVIRREVPGDTLRDPITVHYAPALGTAVLTSDPDHDTRLRAWH